MTHVKAREWIKRLPARRGDDLDAGCKEVLQAHWDHVSWDVERHATGHECWASAATIADEIGSTERAVRDRIDKCCKAGWMRRDGRGWALAWVTPFEVSPGCRTHRPSKMHRSDNGAAPECHSSGTAVTMERHPSAYKRSHDQDIEPSQEQDSASKPAPLVTSTPPDSPDVTHASPALRDIGPDTLGPAVANPAVSPSGPTSAQLSAGTPAGPKPARKRKPPRPKQAALDLPDAPPVDPLEIAHAELLADHERLRAEAYAHHRETMPAWPGPLTATGRAIRMGLRQALRDHGVDACRVVLVSSAALWRSNAANMAAHSLVNMWSASSLEWRIPGKGPNGQRAGPAKRGSTPPLSCEAPGLEVVMFPIPKDGPCL